jgi:hypothetical protein
MIRMAIEASKQEEAVRLRITQVEDKGAEMAAM